MWEVVIALAVTLVGVVLWFGTLLVITLRRGYDEKEKVEW